MTDEIRLAVADILAGGLAAAWPRVRQAWSASDRVYLGPPRGGMPIELALLERMLEERSAESRALLSSGASDADPKVAAYCLVAIHGRALRACDEAWRALASSFGGMDRHAMRNARETLAELPASLFARSDPLRTAHGCFGGSPTLGELASDLRAELLADLAELEAASRST